MKAATPPPAPDPVATANAQAASNVKTATTTQQLNMVDQTTPYGKVNYTQTGTWADGTPKYSNTVTLSPQEQAKQDQQWEFDGRVNNLGIDQTKRLATLLSSPVSLNNEATEARLNELGSKRLDPMFDKRWAGIESNLANQGIAPGSQAYNDARDAFGRERNDAYNQLLLTGRGQSVQEALTERNQPINEITALMNGGQVTQPNFMGTPTTQVAPTDVAGITNNAYQGALQSQQIQQSGNNALYGALGALGGAALGGWASGGFKRAMG